MHSARAVLGSDQEKKGEGYEIYEFARRASPDASGLQ